MSQYFTDRVLKVRLHKDEVHTRIIFIILVLVLIGIIANLVYVNTLLFKNPNQGSKNQHTVSQSITTPPIVTPVPSIVTAPTDANQIPPAQTITQNQSVKDYFIPLGSGTNQSSDWTDVPGVQATIDFNQYTAVKEIHFEASVFVPTANESVSVRLFNVTDHHPVWYSEVTMNGNGSATSNSTPFIYDPGLKTYQVQMKTQLQFQANLTQARIHVILQ